PEPDRTGLPPRSDSSCSPTLEEVNEPSGRAARPAAASCPSAFSCCPRRGSTATLRCSLCIPSEGGRNGGTA
ncbi:hypothetical protein INR49_025432, partial [Caranx melampygus]